VRLNPPLVWKSQITVVSGFRLLGRRAVSGESETAEAANQARAAARGARIDTTRFRKAIFMSAQAGRKPV